MKKLRYAIQKSTKIKLEWILLLFFDPGTQFPWNEKITLCNAEKYYYYYHIIIKEQREAKTSGNYVASRATSAIPELLVSTLFRFFSVGVIELSKTA